MVTWTYPPHSIRAVPDGRGADSGLMRSRALLEIEAVPLTGHCAGC